MNRQIIEVEKTGPEAAQKLNAIFARWASEEARSDHGDEPAWEEIEKILNEGRPADGKPFPES